ncbi:MAG: dCTP deaminase [Candidatus Methanomethylicota archaeon]|uniref:dCTP deaminase n=1 Tax=Thermoproteota archaeon TaxID=2056631 RepID=A0A497F0N6_9CREN|nr:MAG: dCTP deaminase [Candidatus Verstraetearchaeota archaeon]
MLSCLSQGILKIEPFNEKCLNPAGYDLRCAEDLTIPPKTHALAYSMEYIALPTSMIGILQIRSSLAREGVIGSFGFVDPGFRGQLTLQLFNSSSTPISIKKGERIVQLVFIKLSSTPLRSYSGAYQDSRGVVLSKRKS